MVLPLWAAVMPEDGEVGDASEPEEEGVVGNASGPEEEEKEGEVGGANGAAVIMELFSPCPVCMK